MTTLESLPASTAHDAMLHAVVGDVARELDVPVAMVSLMLERAQVSRVALGAPAESVGAGEQTWPAPYCQLVVERGAPVIVNDTAAEPTLPRDLAGGLGIRAYAGVPVRVDGQVVGALCAADEKPRAFVPHVVECLEGLAGRVAERLGAIESLRRLREAQATAGEPAFQESRNALFALTGLQDEARHAMTNLRPVMNVLRSPNLDLRGKVQALRSLDGPLASFDGLEKALIHMEASAFRLQEQLLALEELVAEPGRVCRIDALIVSAERLLHHEAKVHAGMRIRCDASVTTRQVRRAPFLPALVNTVRTVFEFRRPTSSTRSLGSSTPPGDVAPLVLRVAAEGELLVVAIECDGHPVEELESIRARLAASAGVNEGMRFELRAFDVCILTPLVS